MFEYKTIAKSIGSKNQLFKIPKPVSQLSLKTIERKTPVTINKLPVQYVFGIRDNCEEKFLWFWKANRMIAKKAKSSKTLVGKLKILTLTKYKGAQKITKSKYWRKLIFFILVNN